MSSSFREYIQKLRTEKKLLETKKPVSTNLELSAILKSSEPCAVHFPEIKESDFSCAGNIFSTKEMVADSLGIKKEELTTRLMYAIENPTKPNLVTDGPILENTIENPDLSKIPIPTYLEKDGGPYFTSAVAFATDPELGRNISFHRLMVIGKDRVVARILLRHLNTFIERAEKRGEKFKATFVVGLPINILLAGATSVELGTDELGIANTLAPVTTVKLSNGTEIPAEAEFAFEAELTGEMAEEGPFLDLTETYDIIRKQRVFKITKIHHRNTPIFHALLPGGLEHKILMGMPKEPTIFIEVNKVCECKGVNITPGGCSWLHAVVSIKKKKEEDGKNAIEAAFAGHKSLKHVVVVDEDIDITNSAEVEWAIATRFQASKGLVVKLNEKGSSLDPSADPNTYATSKIGLDATKFLIAHHKKEDSFLTVANQGSLHGKNFEKAKYKKINLREYF